MSSTRGIILSHQLQPCPHSHLDQPINASPHLLLPRSRLSLSLVDANPRSSPISRSRFFSAFIPLLEDHSVHKAPSDEASVLVARLDDDEGALYAIERVKPGTYGLCRLGAWVSEEQLEDLTRWGPGVRLPKAPSYEIGTGSDAWWNKATIPSGAAMPDAPPKRRKKDADQQPPIYDWRRSETSRHHEAAAAAAGISATSSVLTGIENTTVQQMAAAGPHASPQDIYLSLIQQYLETLYLSGASLAYFAKGALSRARTACAANQCANGLVACLRNLIMTVSAADKKYKEALPTALKAHTGLDAGSERDKKKAKRKVKTPKRSKDGFLPGESEVLEKWWTSGDDNTISLNADFEQVIKSRLPHLRSRETLLQVVLILEALALEKQIFDDAKQQPTEAETTRTTAESQTIDVPAPDESQSRAKSKKPKDLQSLAETLVDRLTIWQSIETNDDKAKGNISEDGSNTMADITDKVKDFCIDTVVPFYGSRLPELVDKLSEKMGVALASPMRPKPKSKDPFARLAPGTAIARDRLASNRRKPISRVSSDASGKQPRPPPTLIRSATESSLQEIKRERSTTPRSPFLDSRPPSRPLSRSGSVADGTLSKDRKCRSLSRASSISQPNRSLSQREVDFSAITKYNEAKARKKVNVENELKEAIATLKKPNREAAVKPVIEEAQARQTQSKARPSLLAQRRSQLEVEVNATPKRVQKTRDTVIATPYRHPHVVEPENIPSSNPVIPASTLRPAPSVSTLIPRSSPMAARRPNRPFSRAPAPTAYPGLPAAFRSPAVFSTPRKPADAQTAQAVLSSSPPEADIPATPAAPNIIAVPASTRGPLYPSKAKENRIMPPPLLQKSQSTAKLVASQPAAETSIYDALGWGDDVDELM